MMFAFVILAVLLGVQLADAGSAVERFASKVPRINFSKATKSLKVSAKAASDVYLVVTEYTDSTTCSGNFLVNGLNVGVCFNNNDDGTSFILNGLDKQKNSIVYSMLSFNSSDCSGASSTGVATFPAGCSTGGSVSQTFDVAVGTTPWANAAKGLVVQ